MVALRFHVVVFLGTTNNNQAQLRREVIDMSPFAKTIEFPDDDHPLRLDDAYKSHLPKVQSCLRVAFEKSGMTQTRWIRALGKSDRHCFGRWMANPGILKSSQVEVVCQLARVTIDFLRYGPSERPEPGTDIHKRYMSDYFGSQKSEAGALTIEGMRDLYTQLTPKDRYVLSEVAMRLHIAECDTAVVYAQMRKREELEIKLSVLTDDYTYFAGEGADEETIQEWRTAVHNRYEMMTGDVNAKSKDTQEEDHV
jgi:hypothetical protein